MKEKIQNEKDEEKDEQEETIVPDVKTKRKRHALIVVLALFLALAVLLPLSLIDYSEVRSIIFGGKQKEILYCTADFTDIWQNEEYMSAEIQKTLSVTARERSLEKIFNDEESALAAFDELSSFSYGGEVLGAYFTFLIKGLEKKDAPAFAALFSDSYTGNLPQRFPQQKLCNVVLTCLETNDNGRSEWLVNFSIYKNDGLAVTYFGTRDTGSARFTLEEYKNAWRIAAVSTIYQMN